MLLAACRGELDLAKAYHMQKLSGCSEIAELIKEEQLKNPQKQVSEPLKKLIDFIVEAIQLKVGKKPEFEAPDTPIDRKLEWFPKRPIIRKTVLYQSDRLHRTQSELKYQAELSTRNQTGSTTKYKGPTTRSISMEMEKEEEKKEFAESEISCKNDHQTAKGVLPGMFVFSCVHRRILGKFHCYLEQIC